MPSCLHLQAGLRAGGDVAGAEPCMLGMQDSHHQMLALAVSVPLGVCAIMLMLVALLIVQRRRKR